MNKFFRELNDEESTSDTFFVPWKDEQEMNKVLSQNPEILGNDVKYVVGQVTGIAGRTDDWYTSKSLHLILVEGKLCKNSEYLRVSSQSLLYSFTTSTERIFQKIKRESRDIEKELGVSKETLWQAWKYYLEPKRLKYVILTDKITEDLLCVCDMEQRKIGVDSITIIELRKYKIENVFFEYKIRIFSKNDNQEGRVYGSGHKRNRNFSLKSDILYLKDFLTWIDKTSCSNENKNLFIYIVNSLKEIGAIVTVKNRHHPNIRIKGRWSKHASILRIGVIEIGKYGNIWEHPEIVTDKMLEIRCEIGGKIKKRDNGIVNGTKLSFMPFGDNINIARQYLKSLINNGLEPFIRNENNELGYDLKNLKLKERYHRLHIRLIDIRKHEVDALIIATKPFMSLSLVDVYNH